MTTATKTNCAAPTKQPEGAFARRVEVVRFLLDAGAGMRDPIVFLTLVSGLSRAGMIFAINETAQRYDEGMGWPVALLLLCAAAMVVSGYFQKVRAFTLITRIEAQMRNRLSELLLRANIDFLISRRHGKVYGAMTAEVNQLAQAVIHLVEAIGAALVLMCAIPYLFYVSWIAGVAAVAAIAFGGIGFAMMDGPARRWATKASDAFAAYCDRVTDMLSGWKELRLRASRRDALEAETKAVITAQVANKMRSERLFAASTGGGQLAVALLMCFVVIVLPALSGGNAIVMFQVLTIIFLVNGPTELVFNTLPVLSRAEASYFKIKGVETELAAAQSHALSVASQPLERFTGIALRGVEARVGDTGRADVAPFHLGPIDLTFQPGETVFICGGNGSGKTTLLSLITGMRHPEVGEILLNDMPLTDETTATYRELFSAVFAQFHLFDHAYGMPEAELRELEARISQLGLAERVSLLGDKFSTTSLSAGQSRRLALAVALAEQKPIIVLDEFAADQDPANRAFFYDVLMPELSASGRLVLAVTHDDHQFGKCDRLIKMEAGRIVSDERMRARKEA
ncbi:cyclic peptide export ABC transporter [Shimia sp. MMG029]|uniref:cyclic peptide export ABC transporter n=1 Tax=Shimia sp. MMG029 TaxID=3021978 RepID=UPI0022FDDC2B|nr:cyclic peptide export ABC transporter [Shimia sp. MMG029]MDA5557515.1 cyclic peptide export ABC transporter [Shimia sp. MMG029]